MDSILSTSVDSYSIFHDWLIRIAHIKPATAEASETFTHRGVVPSGEVGKKPWLRAWTPPRLSPPRARGRGASLGCAPGPCQEGCDAGMVIRLGPSLIGERSCHRRVPALAVIRDNKPWLSSSTSLRSRSARFRPGPRECRPVPPAPARGD